MPYLSIKDLAQDFEQVDCEDTTCFYREPRAMGGSSSGQVI